MSSKDNFAEDYLTQTQSILKKISTQEMLSFSTHIWKAYQQDRTIFFIGNGGSASTATHMAADIGKNTIRNHKDPQEKRFKTISLCDNTAWLTAIGNDISYQDIFIEQLKNFANPGDLLVIITGSGNSLNLVNTALWAKASGLTSIGLLGFDGGYLKQILDFSLIVDSNSYGQIESIHSLIHHYIVDHLKFLKLNE